MFVFCVAAPLWYCPVQAAQICAYWNVGVGVPNVVGNVLEINVIALYLFLL
jgi:hypothetical protein